MEMVTPFSSIKNESKKIKDWYGVSFAKIFSLELNISNNARFVNEYKKELPALELKERLNLLSELIDRYLPGSYHGKLKKLSHLLGAEWPHETGMLNYGFHLYPVSQFIENHALIDSEASVIFIKQLTKRFTGEFAVRTIANHDQNFMLKTAKAWSKDDSFHVRRLASEGLRARLPWGKGVGWIKESPEKTLPILTSLRNDPSLYVRRSVANAMGDIIKINPDLAINTFENWLSKKHTKETLWIISHAIRHPVKKNNKVFLKLKNRILK